MRVIITWTINDDDLREEINEYVGGNDVDQSTRYSSYNGRNAQGLIDSLERKFSRKMEDDDQIIVFYADGDDISGVKIDPS